MEYEEKPWERTKGRRKYKHIVNLWQQIGQYVAIFGPKFEKRWSLLANPVNILANKLLTFTIQLCLERRNNTKMLRISKNAANWLFDKFTCNNRLRYRQERAHQSYILVVTLNFSSPRFWIINIRDAVPHFQACIMCGSMGEWKFNEPCTARRGLWVAWIGEPGIRSHVTMISKETH